MNSEKKKEVFLLCSIEGGFCFRRKSFCLTLKRGLFMIDVTRDFIDEKIGIPPTNVNKVWQHQQQVLIKSKFSNVGQCRRDGFAGRSPADGNL